MRIVFGTNSLLIKSYTPVELGFSNPNVQDWKIEHRQNYFHLYGLPTFPTSTFWCIKKPNDSNKYELTHQQIVHIESLNLIHKFNWLSALLPILLIIGFVGIVLSIYYKDYQEEKKSEISLDFISQKIINPSNHDYIVLNALNDSRKSSTIYCKVIDFNKDSIKLAISDSLIAYFEIDFFKGFNKSNILKTKWIAKKDLMKIQKSFADEYSKRVKIPYFNDSNSLIIGEIKEVDGPFFETQCTEFNLQSKTISAIVTNEGYPVEILSFKKKDDKNYIDWNVEDISNGEGLKFKFIGKIKRDKETVNYNEEYAKKMLYTIHSEVICKDLETLKNVTIEINQYESDLTFFRIKNE